MLISCFECVLSISNWIRTDLAEGGQGGSDCRRDLRRSRPEFQQATKCGQQTTKGTQQLHSLRERYTIYYLQQPLTIYLIFDAVWRPNPTGFSYESARVETGYLFPPFFSFSSTHTHTRRDTPAFIYKIQLCTDRQCLPLFVAVRFHLALDERVQN